MSLTLSAQQFVWLQKAIVRSRSVERTLEKMHQLSRRVVLEHIPGPKRRKSLPINPLRNILAPFALSAIQAELLLEGFELGKNGFPTAHALSTDSNPEALSRRLKWAGMGFGAAAGFRHPRLPRRDLRPSCRDIAVAASTA